MPVVCGSTRYNDSSNWLVVIFCGVRNWYSIFGFFTLSSFWTSRLALKLTSHLSPMNMNFFYWVLCGWLVVHFRGDIVLSARKPYCMALRIERSEFGLSVWLLVFGDRLHVVLETPPQNGVQCGYRPIVFCIRLVFMCSAYKASWGAFCTYSDIVEIIRVLHGVDSA